MLRGQGLGPAYQAELAKTSAFRKIFSRGNLERAPWGCDASLYSSRSFAGRGFLLAGDAGAFIDPLSSFGVKKAMVSAWVGAVVANTWLRRPEMQETALRFFDGRERQVYADYLDQSAGWFRASGRSAHPFWARRSEIGEPTARKNGSGEIKLALDDLKRKPSIRLRRAEDVRMEPQPRIEGREIVLRNALVTASAPAGLNFIESVDVPRLIEIAEQHAQVPDLFEAYNRACPPVELPQFLAALATLVARGILVDRTANS